MSASRATSPRSRFSRQSTRRASSRSSTEGSALGPGASASAVHPFWRHIASHWSPREFWSSHSTMYRSVNIWVLAAISCPSILPPSLIFLSRASRRGSFQYW
jgi:hypothetical protein